MVVYAALPEENVQDSVEVSNTGIVALLTIGQ